MDGHTGTSIASANQGSTGSFSLTLALVKQSSGDGDFVIHATSSTSYGSIVDPRDFLERIGFKHFSGNCTFHGSRCYYYYLGSIRPFRGGHRDIGMFHNGFRIFVEKIEELYNHFRQQEEILRVINISKGPLSIFAKPIIINVKEEDIPTWVDVIKFKRLTELESQHNAIIGEIEDLKEYLPLIYGTGAILENAVVKALKFLGLKAETTEPGFTVDILAETTDGSKTFGFEVTGIKGSIKKDTPKLSQVMDFEMKKEKNEKTILVANTYNNSSISEREGKENFTTNVVSVLSRHPVLLMTGWDLYCMVRDVMEGGKNKADIIELIYTEEGELDY